MTPLITFDHHPAMQITAGETLEQVLSHLPSLPTRPMAALVNGTLQELDYPLFTDSTVSWLDYHCAEGWRIYQRSVVFLMQAAAKELFPTRELWINHTQGDSLYCWLRDEHGLTAADADLQALEKKMRSMVEAKVPITRMEIDRTDAAAFFRKHHNPGKASLMERREEKYVSVYTLGVLTDYFFGRMAINTSYLDEFSIFPHHEGFLLKLPLRSFIGYRGDDHQTLAGMLDASVADYTQWSGLMNVRTAGDLNALVEAGSREYIDFSLAVEALQDRVLHSISDSIFAHFPKARLVLIAGPSSAGKTTTTRRLAIQFRALGIKPVVISLDDYFVDREHTPLTPEGKPDLESINALDTSRFNRDMMSLLEGRETVLPRFDFLTGSSIPEFRSIRLGEDEILLVEGIHALNSQLTYNIPPQNKRGMFISTMSQVNLDACNPFSASDSRLLRRIVRDCQFRGYSAEQTLDHWLEVRRGEHLHIFPWVKNAAYFINSSLLYELPVLRPLAEPALSAILPTSPSYLEAQRLLKLIRYFAAADSAVVPSTSILREFIGNGLFNDDSFYSAADE